MKIVHMNSNAVKFGLGGTLVVVICLYFIYEAQRPSVSVLDDHDRINPKFNKYAAKAQPSLDDVQKFQQFNVEDMSLEERHSPKVKLSPEGEALLAKMGSKADKRIFGVKVYASRRPLKALDTNLKSSNEVHVRAVTEVPGEFVTAQLEQEPAKVHKKPQVAADTVIRGDSFTQMPAEKQDASKIGMNVRTNGSYSKDLSVPELNKNNSTMGDIDEFNDKSVRSDGVQVHQLLPKIKITHTSTVVKHKNSSAEADAKLGSSRFGVEHLNTHHKTGDLPGKAAEKIHDAKNDRNQQMNDFKFSSDPYGGTGKSIHVANRKNDEKPEANADRHEQIGGVTTFSTNVEAASQNKDEADQNYSLNISAHQQTDDDEAALRPDGPKNMVGPFPPGEINGEPKHLQSNSLPNNVHKASSPAFKAHENLNLPESHQGKIAQHAVNDDKRNGLSEEMEPNWDELKKDPLKHVRIDPNNPKHMEKVLEHQKLEHEVGKFNARAVDRIVNEDQDSDAPPPGAK